LSGCSLFENIARHFKYDRNIENADSATLKFDFSCYHQARDSDQNEPFSFKEDNRYKVFTKEDREENELSEN
jgi:hypothetical protein